MQSDRDEIRLSEAAKVSLETQQMTPLIKEELRLSIMKKRHASGQDEIKVEFPEPKQYELTDQEKAKRERRREQNRRAARRCRQKKKLLQNGSQVVFSTIVKQNDQLKAEVRKLRKESRILGGIMTKHVQSGTCRQSEIEAQVGVFAPESAIPSPPVYCDQNYACAMTSVDTLPAFHEAFSEHRPISNDFDQYTDLADVNSDFQLDRNWPDDVTPSENLPEMIFEALDDVFYDNEPLPTKIPQDVTINFDVCNMEENWSHMELEDALTEPGFRPGILNEP